MLWLLLLAASRSLTSYARPQGSIGAQQTQGPKCICAFDFDLTLRVPQAWNGYQDGAAYEGQQVLWACRKAPCHIGLASGNANWQKIKSVLQANYGTSIFSANFFNSKAFQYGRGDKSISLRALSDYFQVPYPCMTLFDDSDFNRKYATSLGSHFEKVNPKYGVQMSNYYSAVQAMPSYCFTGGQRP